MKKYLIAVIFTCIGALFINLNIPPVNPPVTEEVSPRAQIEPTAVPIVPTPTLTPVEPVQAIVDPPVAPEPVYAGYAGSNRELYALAGIPEADWAGVERIYGQESGVCHLKWQGQYGACPTTYVLPYPGAETDSSKGYGICQSTPAIKMASEGEDWRTNPVTQMRWCYKYTLSYGSVQEAINFKYCLATCWSSRTKTTVYKHTPWF